MIFKTKILQTKKKNDSYFYIFFQKSMLILTSNNFTISTIRSALVFRRIFNDLALTFLSKMKNLVKNIFILSVKFLI